MTSRKNQIWGRIYDIGKTESGGRSSVCTSGGPHVKSASLHLQEFDFYAIKIDRDQFAQQLRQYKKNTLNQKYDQR